MKLMRQPCSAHLFHPVTSPRLGTTIHAASLRCFSRMGPFISISTCRPKSIRRSCRPALLANISMQISRVGFVTHGYSRWRAGTLGSAGCKAASSSRFSSIVVFAQHLAVRGYGLSALVPRLDVVAFHLIQLKLLLALHADSLLPLISFPLHVSGERADVQVSFIPIEHIWVDSRFPP